MTLPDSFVHDYRGTDLVYGRNCVGRLESMLADRGLSRALVVCGTNVGANRDVMDPIEDGLGDRLAGVFDGTTPDKTVDQMYETIDAMREVDADVVIALGSGSSINVARQATAFAVDERSVDDIYDEAEPGMRIEPSGPTEEVVPHLVVPTTFAGADLAGGGSILVPGVDGAYLYGSGRYLFPESIFYDPDLFDTTPMGVLEGSAMNGFNKGIENIYSRGTDPMGHSTAMYGLRLFREGLPRLGDDPEAMEKASVAIALVQMHRQTSVIHAFGHGFSRPFDVQQGVAHGILAPHVVRYVMGKVHGSRDLIAEGLGIDHESMEYDELGEAIADDVAALVDALDIPRELRTIDGLERDDLSWVAESIVGDPTIEAAPEGLDPTAEEVEAILEAAW